MWVPRGSSTEIPELVTISRVEWIDKNTATSFLLLLFFSGKRKVKSPLYKKPKIDRKFRRQSHHPPHNVSKGQALRVLKKKCFVVTNQIPFPPDDWPLLIKNSKVTFFSKTLTAYPLPPMEMAFFFSFFSFEKIYLGRSPKGEHNF